MNTISKGVAGNSRSFVFTAILFAAALFLGGSSRPEVFSTTLVRIVAVIAFGYMLCSSAFPAAKAIQFASACIALVLIQILPLPFAIWSALPGRELETSITNLLPNKHPWEPISFYPLGTWNALLSWLPPFSLYWMARSLDQTRQRMLVAVAIAVAVISSMLGLAQMEQGPSSALRFYAITNPNAAVAFFANRNHAAIFFASTIVLALWWTAEGGLNQFREIRRRLIGFTSTAILLAGLVATGSRAGIALGLLGLISSLWIFHGQWMYHAPRRYVGTALGALISAGIIAWVQFSQLLVRLFATSPADDLRFLVLPDLVNIVRKTFPVGTGFGTFDTTYQIFERVETMRSTYLNHAHNDLVELAIEGGLPALILLSIALFWIARSTRRILSLPLQSRGKEICIAALIVITMLLLHSLLDYPLRTPALSCLFALCVAIIARADDDNFQFRTLSRDIS